MPKKLDGERRISATSVPELDEEKKELEQMNSSATDKQAAKFDYSNSFRYDYVNKLLPLQMILSSDKNLDSLKKYIKKVPKLNEVYPDEPPDERDLADIANVDRLIDEINMGQEEGTMDKATMLKKINEAISIIRKL